MSQLQSRVLILQAAPDDAAQYIPVINCAFSAQRMALCLDSMCVGRHGSTLLQQCAHTTGGVHTHPTPAVHAALYEHMVSLYLPEPALRSLLLLPPQHSVDLRASCFCHKRPLELGWICSVCLSIWCKQSSSCAICGLEATASTAATGTVMAGMALLEGGGAAGGGAGSG